MNTPGPAPRNKNNRLKTVSIVIETMMTSIGPSHKVNPIVEKTSDNIETNGSRTKSTMKLVIIITGKTTNPNTVMFHIYALQSQAK